MTEAQFDRLLQAIGDIQTRVATIDARTQALEDRQKSEISSLFSDAREATARISAIERDYTPQSKFDTFVHDKDDRLDEIEKAVNGMSAKMAWVFGIATVIAWVIGMFGPRLIGGGE